MNGQILTPCEAHEHLQKVIPVNTPGREQVLEISKWICERNETLTGNNRIFCRIREEYNVGYVIDRDNNSYKKSTPNFMVIKVNTRFERYEKEFHVDFYLEAGGYPDPHDFPLTRKNDLKRWALKGRDCISLDMENFRGLVIAAYETRGGIGL